MGGVVSRGAGLVRSGVPGRVAAGGRDDLAAGLVAEEVIDLERVAGAEGRVPAAGVMG